MTKQARSRMFTYKLISPDGVLVEYTTIKKTATDLIKGHEMTVDFFQKNGWQVERQVTTKENGKYVCNDCGSEAELKSGVSKTGKSWKGIFCKENKNHVRWI